MAIEAKFSSSAAAKNAKWFSRRHKTGDACDLNKATRSLEARKLARQEKAAQRAAMRVGRTPQQQVTLLDQRLGVGEGARKERERLFMAR